MVHFLVNSWDLPFSTALDVQHQACQHNSPQGHSYPVSRYPRKLNEPGSSSDSPASLEALVTAHDLHGFLGLGVKDCGALDSMDTSGNTGKESAGFGTTPTNSLPPSCGETLPSSSLRMATFSLTKLSHNSVSSPKHRRNGGDKTIADKKRGLEDPRIFFQGPKVVNKK